MSSRRMYVEVAVGKDEIIRKIKESKSMLRPDWEFVDSPDNATAILTDTPRKFYPTPKHVLLYCTHENGFVNPGEGWPEVKIPHVMFDEE